MANPQKVVTIEALSDKPDKSKFSIMADGNWYSGFKKWEGEDTTVYSQFKMGNHNMPFKKGDQALITYTLGEYNGEVVYNLKSMYPSDSPRPAETPRYESNIASQSESREDYGRRLAVHGLLNGLVGFKGLAITREDIQQVIAIEDVINEELAKPKGWAGLGQKLKQEAEEVDSDGIPS